MTATEDHVTPHIIQTEIDGLPFAYQRSVLRTDPGRRSDAAAEIDELIQRGSDSSMTGLNVQVDPHDERLVVLAGRDDVDALAVRDRLLARGLKANVGLVPVYLTDDPIMGMTVKHGHGTTREGIYLAGLAPPPGSSAVEAGRRPVVAVLDTPVRRHRWLGDGDGDDSFWRDARQVEDGWEPRFEVPKENANGRRRAAGHGTFIAGMVRLLAADARVLSVPVMHGNGVVEEEHVLDALGWLVHRVTTAADPGRREGFVDVVNMSFGRYLNSGEDEQFKEETRNLLGELARLGVRVVASAGNRPVTDDVFPAILSDDDGDPDNTALVSVGARDPDGSLADYTSTGDWVTVKAPGTSMVSALPKFRHTDYPLPDDFDDDGDLRQPDPNFQASGVGQWSGTSFAAAWVSASIAAKLLEQATPGSLADTSSTVAGARAKSAWDAVVADLEAWTASHDLVD